jgi:hypothetical protein
VDWAFKTLFIGLTKNGEPLLAPLSEAAIDRLNKIPRRDDNPHIICGAVPGSPLINLRKPWVRMRAEANMPDVRLHDVRRTVGSWLVQDGSTLHLVGSVLNHKDPKTTAGYAYFQTQQREQALTRHGRQVLRFLPSMPGAQAPACYEIQPTASLPPADAPVTANRAHYLEREVLYRLIWEAPVSEVAHRFGISDVGLAKVCRRAAIPLPTKGYWAKAAAGSDLKPSSLPPAPAGLPRLIRIRGHKGRSENAGSDQMDHFQGSPAASVKVERWRHAVEVSGSGA